VDSLLSNPSECGFGRGVLFCTDACDQKARKLLFRIGFCGAGGPGEHRFSLLYLSPLFVDQLSDLNLNVLVPALGVYALLLASSYSYHFNPMLSLAGWHFYKVGSKEGVSYVLLTRKKIRNVDRIKKVGQLTGYMLLDLSELLCP